jgi:hypothetical protein
MKLLLPLLGVLLLAGCSKPDDKSSADSQANAKPHQFHRYQVTFAAVKAPNELLRPYTTNRMGPDSIKVRYQIASYLLAHTNDFPIITPQGNFVPLVTTSHGTGGRFLLDARQEEMDLAKTGIQLTLLEMNVEVGDEDDQGSVRYDGMAVYGRAVSPTGGEGGDIPFPGGMLPIGQADLLTLYEGKDFTLCALVKLTRAK